MAAMTTRVGNLVVDSGAFIRNVPLQNLGEHIITVQDVLAEIRDKATKERLQVLPYQLDFREPSQESIKRVTEFSKKTGDYASLSAVDLQVLALSYQLEKEHVGTDHIKTVPDSKITWSSTKGHLENPSEIAGFYLGKKKPGTRSAKTSTCSTASDMCTDLAKVSLSAAVTENSTGKETDPEHEQTPGATTNPSRTEPQTLQPTPTPPVLPTTMSWASVVKKPAVAEPVEKKDNGLELEIANSAETDNPSEPGAKATESDGADAEMDILAENNNPTKTDKAKIEMSIDSGESPQCVQENIETESTPLDKPIRRCLEEGDTLPTEVLEEEEDSDEEEDEEEDEDEDDDDDGWITPNNIQEVKASMGDANFEPAAVAVGCLTTDFAIQNVLIQMGLNVVSVEGMLIKRAKSYVLRCYGCYKVTTNVMRDFCHHCGNKTLQKVSMTVNEDGSIRYFLSRRRAVGTRGTKFSLPAPKGGKHCYNPILCEDQQGPHQRMGKKSKVKYNVLDPNYAAHASPFAPIDTQSRSAQLGIRDHKHAFSKKRNPNENHKVYGRRK